MELGRTIRIYLADGNPTGIKYAEMVNWTVQAVVCPRSRLSELSKWPEAQRPGAYLLVGESAKGPLVYIGESENVWKRLQHHLSKEFWNRVLFVTCKDDNLTKGHVKYLESKLQELAACADRIAVEKGKNSDEPKLPRPDRDAMEEFIQCTRILLGALEFPFLEPLTPAVTGTVTATPAGASGGLVGIPLSLVVRKTGVEATGSVSDQGFVVLKGSKGARAVKDSLPPVWKALRDKLIADGSLQVSTSVITFAKDVLFTSPSAAAAVVVGGNRNGREGWKASDGRSLKAIEDALNADDSPATEVTEVESEDDPDA